MTHPLITDEMVEKVFLDTEFQPGDIKKVIRNSLESIAPDIWNAAVERCVEELERRHLQCWSVGAGIMTIRSIKHQPSGKE